MSRSRLLPYILVSLICAGGWYLLPFLPLLPSYTPFTKHPRTLADRLAQHAGIYADKARIDEDRGAEGIRAETLRRTVLFSTANWGFVDLALNFLCTLRLVGSYDLLIIAQDLLAYDLLLSLGVEVLYVGTDFNMTDASVSATDWGTGAYEALVKNKAYFLYEVLRRGYHAMMVDVDVVVSGDFVPDILEGIDLEWQQEWSAVAPDYVDGDWGEGCTGFMFMRSSNLTIDFVRQTLDSFHSGPQDHDQRMMNNMLKEWKSTDRAMYLARPFPASLPRLLSNSAEINQLSFTSFPALAYSAGLDWIERSDQFAAAWTRSHRPGPAVPLAAHANYLIGHERKVQAFVDHGMWAVDDELIELFKHEFRKGHEAHASSEAGGRRAFGDDRHWTDFCLDPAQRRQPGPGE